MSLNPRLIGHVSNQNLVMQKQILVFEVISQLEQKGEQELQGRSNSQQNVWRYLRDLEVRGGHWISNESCIHSVMYCVTINQFERNVKNKYNKMCLNSISNRYLFIFYLKRVVNLANQASWQKAGKVRYHFCIINSSSIVPQ